MAKTRLELLEEMVAQDPKSVLARYGLAQEYAGAGRLEEALAEFQRLLETNPDYPAAYFHGGKTLEKLGRIEEARAMYQGGVEASARAGDAHAQSEIQAALDLLG